MSATTQVPLLEIDEKVDGGSTFSVSDVVDAIGNGPFQIKLVVVFGAIWVYLAVIAAVQPFFVDGMIDRMEMSSLQGGIISASLLIGLIVGNTSCGFIADAYGRKPTMVVCLVLTSVAGVVGYMSDDFWVLAGSRVLAGAASGGTTMTMNTYFAEMCPSGPRGKYLTILHLAWTIGVAMAVQLSAQFDKKEWRLLMAVSCSAGVVLGPLVWCCVPESVHFLFVSAHKNKLCAADEVEPTLRSMAEENRAGELLGASTVCQAFADVHFQGGSLHVPTAAQAENGVLAVIFAPQTLCSVTLPLWGCFLCANYAGYGNFMWLNEFLHRMGYGKYARLEYLGFAAAEAVGVVLMTCVIDLFKRKHMLIIAFLGAGLTCLGFVFVADDDIMFALVLMCGTAFFEQSVWSILYVIVGEVYPSNVRNTASGLAMGPTRMGGVVSTTLGRYMMNIDVHLPFYLTGSALILGALLALVLGSDKTGQKIDDF